MWTNAILLIPWLLAAITAYYFIGTLGTKLQKDNPALYDLVSKDKNNIQDAIDTEKDNKTNLEAQLKAIQNDKDENGDPVALDSAKLELKAKTQEAIGKSQSKIDYYEKIKVKGLDSWDWSWKNIGWVAGIFLIVGIVLHLITKFVLSFITKNNKE